jgi:hypothetical protein
MEGWYLWKRSPMACRWACLGMITEIEAKNFVDDRMPRLTIDDLIDLHIGIKRWLSE